MANWKQDLSEAVNAINGINRNTAVLQYRLAESEYDKTTGDVQDAVCLEREIVIAGPETVKTSVNGTFRQAGDLVCTVSFQQLKNARKKQESDPEIRIGGIMKTFDELRPDNANTCGIEPGRDVLIFAGDVFHIANLSGNDWLENEPASYTLVLRR